MRVMWRLGLPLAALLALAACDDPISKAALEMAKERYVDSGVAPPPPPAEGVVMPRPPSAPLNTARIDEAKLRVELAGARAAVREYRMVHGDNPPSLGALDLNLRFRADLTYDPATGRVKSRTYPQY